MTKPLSQLIAEYIPEGMVNEDYEKLKQVAVELAKCVEHIADSNYAASEQGVGYTTRTVCVELYTDKELDAWADDSLTKARSILEGGC